jgi:predicted NAD/FAD-dependent oxidoreductase
MAVVDEHAGQPAWDVALPPDGPLAWIIRNDRKPGRPFERGHAHYVVHAKADWSAANLELADADVQATMLAALADILPAPPRWRFSQAHRWRAASVVGAGRPTLQPFWFDADQGLGVCGDYLGGNGVEGAWTSGDALAEHVARQQEPVRQTPCHHENRSTT